MPANAIAIATITPPTWIVALVDLVKDAVQPYGFIGPLGYRWWEPGNPTSPNSATWVVIVFPTPNEVHGGPHDGGKFVSGFRLDISQILAIFASTYEVAWSNPTQYNGDLDGPEISISGLFLSQPVWLRVFSIPPSDEPVSFVVDYHTKEVTEKSEGG